MVKKRKGLNTSNEAPKENIDDLFDSLKKKKAEKLDAEAAEREEKKIRKKAEKLEQKQSIEHETSSSYGLISSDLASKIISPEAPLERIDAESGLPVYKAHLLKVGEGGGTALCPFDCDCCFG